MQFVIHKSTSVYECSADKPASWTSECSVWLVKVRPHSRLMQNRHVMNQRRRLATYEFATSNGELDPRSPNGPFCRESLPYSNSCRNEFFNSIVRFRNNVHAVSWPYWNRPKSANQLLRPKRKPQRAGFSCFPGTMESECSWCRAHGGIRRQLLRQRSAHRAFL